MKKIEAKQMLISSNPGEVYLQVFEAIINAMIVLERIVPGIF